MRGLSRTSKWKGLVPIVLLVFFTLAMVRGVMVYTLGWLGFLAGGTIYSSEESNVRGCSPTLLWAFSSWALFS